MRFSRLRRERPVLSREAGYLAVLPATPQRRMAACCCFWENKTSWALGGFQSHTWFFYPTPGWEVAEKDSVRHILVTRPNRWLLTRGILFPTCPLFLWNCISLRISIGPWSGCWGIPTYYWISLQPDDIGHQIDIRLICRDRTYDISCNSCRS